ncbi:MAG TPA: DUF6544 family protein [Armatimonadota bacterium]|nr:DUF6544 family protein [Armatimonadota bacterium]
MPSPSLSALWASAPPPAGPFHPDHTACLPEPARRYLTHTIAPGTPLASAVRLRMHGEIRLQQQWYPFTAEQVIRRDGEMLWRAATRIRGLPVTGFDCLNAGQGRMQWKLLGLFPVLASSGPDVTRSAAGRVLGESVWLPSRLCAPDVTWTAPDPAHARADLSLLGEWAHLTLALTDDGALQSLCYQRWGNPGGPYQYTPFGGFVEQEATFDGYTLPSRLRLGWHFGTDRFEPEGEFFRVTLTHAAFR